jgi:hypothetical protein
MRFLLAAQPQIGQVVRSCPRAGQYSRPNRMIWMCVSFQRSLGKHLLEVLLGLLDRLAGREPPARGEPMDVRVDRERRDSERLRHHDARGLVTHAGQALELLERLRHLALVLVDEDLRELRERLGLLRREAARPDQLVDLLDRHLRHRFGVGGAGEQRGRDEIDARIGRLRGEQDGDEEGETDPGGRAGPRGRGSVGRGSPGSGPLSRGDSLGENVPLGRDGIHGRRWNARSGPDDPSLGPRDLRQMSGRR